MVELKVFTGIIVAGLIAILGWLIWSGGYLSVEGGVWAAIIVVAIVFFLLIYLGCKTDGHLDKGEMRRAIAGTFVVGFTILIFLLIAYEDIQNKDVVTAYLQMVGVIVGFYFGSKSALEAVEKTKGSDEATAVRKVIDAAKEAKKSLGNEQDKEVANKVIGAMEGALRSDEDN